MSRQSERGETLIELVVAVVILGIAGTAIAGGLATSVLASDYHRKQATAGALVRDYAEAVETAVAAPGGYVSCATGYPTTFSPPSGYAASATVTYWNGSGFQATCGTDQGLQQLTLQVHSSDNRATERLVIVVRKPCGGTLCTS